MTVFVTTPPAPPSVDDAPSVLSSESAHARLSTGSRWRTVTSLVGMGIVATMCAGVALAVHAQRQPVLVLTHDKGWSEHITVADLAAVDFVGTPVDAIPASERSTVVGQQLATAAGAGTVLTVKHFGSPWFPPGGGRLIGLRTDIGQRPAQPLRAGALVCVSPLPAALDCDADGSARGGSFRARVAITSTPDADGEAVVDVIVGRHRAGAAIAAASQDVLITLIGP
jgi:hypothetical protein